ncbi:MAG: hypothetical protein QME63_03800 [Actinomycetota bacterium]|nr:hypothetical protein [Actinomycetota bacterium]
MSEHKLPAKFVKKIQGRDFVLFEGLLDMAHASGLKRVETQLLQAPNKDNGMLAIVRAIVETDQGVFSALGDASPESAERPMQPHLVRLADTRAIARAIRIAVNVGMTAVEEINANEQIMGSNNGKRNVSKNGEDETKSEWLDNPEAVILSFGKHADRTLGDVLRDDPTYVEWIAKEAYDYVLRTAARKLLEMSSQEVNEVDTGEAKEAVLTES